MVYRSMLNANFLNKKQPKKYLGKIRCPKLITEPEKVIDMGKREKRIYLESIRSRYRRLGPLASK
ncbi:hypothetical protein NNRS527_00017 [Nitrosospira sp. NRS527]|nr:hypothetical protein NNRS527_00017 [Nitrosospira sp. NRS527]